MPPRIWSVWTASLITSAACASEPAPTAVDGGSDGGPGGDASDNPCAFRLVRLQTGADPSCAGGNTHAWPVGMAPTACHGWRAVDTMGRQHDNSANDIRCNADGTFSFVQFAGGLDCSGGGVLKTYALDVCKQDIPPTLHTVAVDLTCCSNPASPACVTDTPSVSVPGGTTFLNGAPCRP
jgi:hypothetical protein